MVWNSSILFAKDLEFTIKKVSIVWLAGLLCSAFTLIWLDSDLSTFISANSCGLIWSNLLPTTVLIFHGMFLPLLHPLFLAGICATTPLFKVFLSQGLGGLADSFSLFRNSIEYFHFYHYQKEYHILIQNSTLKTILLKNEVDGYSKKKKKKLSDCRTISLCTYA